MITCSLPILSSQKQTTTAAESEKACEKHCTYIFFFIPAQVDICGNARETPPVCFQNEPMYLRKRKKERLLLCQQVQVAKNNSEVVRWHL